MRRICAALGSKGLTAVFLTPLGVSFILFVMVQHNMLYSCAVQGFIESFFLCRNDLIFVFEIVYFSLPVSYKLFLVLHSQACLFRFLIKLFFVFS